MKNILTLALSIALTSFGYAQKNEPAIAKVHYEFKHVNDSTQPEKFLRDELILYLGQESSYITSNSNHRMKELLDEQLKSATFDGTVNIVRAVTPTKESYYIEPFEKKITQVYAITTDLFKTPEPWEDIKWTILPESKEIGSYSCQLATTRFKGRNYEVWFTTELPFSFGPWKLNGLPGLILEATDDKKEVQFLYQGFDKIEDNAHIIEVPKQAIASSKKEIEKVETAFKANPQAYISAKNNMRISQSSGNAIVMKSNSTNSSSTDMSKIKNFNISTDANYKPSTITNNPIEISN